MASKQPFKLINIAQTLTTWSIRINKFFKHRLLSKRKHVLLISDDELSNVNALKSLYVVEKGSNPLIKITRDVTQQANKEEINFEKVLLKNMYKTWEISQIKSINAHYQDAGLLSNSASNQDPTKNPNSSKQIKTAEQQTNAQQPSAIVLPNFTDKEAVQALQNHWLSKKKYFDSIIVLPEKQQNNTLYPQITDQAFATTFISTFEQKIMKNMVAYRYAHKFLNTSGTFIQSTSQYDFLKKTDDEKKKDEQKKIESKTDEKQDLFCYAESRPPASKQLIDNTIAYLGVLVGDRDHTDLNSWTLVSLGEQASWKNPQYVGRMYYDWADGQHLPMPGSFALFKKKTFENKKQLDFIQYL